MVFATTSAADMEGGVVQKQVFSGYTAERKRPAQAGGMMVRNLNKSAAL